LNERRLFAVTAAVAAAWFAFVWWLFPIATGIDLTHTEAGPEAPTRWVMSLGPVGALLFAEVCLLGVSSPRWGGSRGRYVLGVPFMCLALAGTLTAAVAPLAGTYC